MPSSATLAAGTLSLHPAPPSRSGGSPSPRLDGEGGEARGGLWDYYFFFFTLRKNASAGEGGEEGSKFLPLCYRSCLAKAETEKAIWPGKAMCELGAPLAEVGWGDAWQCECLPWLEGEGPGPQLPRASWSPRTLQSHAAFHTDPGSFLLLWQMS